MEVTGSIPSADKDTGALIVTSGGMGVEGNLNVGGSFASAGGVAANNIAKWDGVNWSGLNKADFIVDMEYADADNLRITELNYNPGDADISAGEADVVVALTNIPAERFPRSPAKRGDSVLAPLS